MGGDNPNRGLFQKGGAHSVFLNAVKQQNTKERKNYFLNYN